MKPIFSITNKMLKQMIEISQAIGSLEFQVESNLRLRSENRLMSIHSSLAIENNSLTFEQITAIIDGKRVLGDPKEIQEVKNAYDAYEEILALRPYEQKDFLYAHALLTKDIVNESGQYRHKDVGVFNAAGKVVHLGARPQFIGELMADLFSWGVEDKTPELIKSCVFHYEIEVIHPLEDGNGRMGRLWQTVILANWNSIFAWIPIETIIYEHQQAYYDALASAGKQNAANVFIEFMLDVILKTLNAYKPNGNFNDIVSDKVHLDLTTTENTLFKLLEKYLKDHKSVSTAVASKLAGKAAPTVRRYLVKFVSLGLLEAHGQNRNRVYSLKK